MKTARPRRPLLPLFFLPLVLAVGCSSSDGSPDAAPPDTGPLDVTVDLTVDQGPDQSVDVGPDAFAALAGVGELSGACGVLDEAAWAADTAAFSRNALDFGDSYDFDPAELSPGGKKILAEGNLNEGSLHSEIVAFEVLRRCELAVLLKTEGKIDYLDADGKKTDLLVEIDGRKVGVSVTRAMGYPLDAPYSVDQARELLAKKLGDLPLSASNAKDPDRWQRSLLAVLAYGPEHADVLQQAFNGLDAATRGDAILVVTVTDGDDAFIY